METPIRIALVDDQQLVRAGFRMVLESQPDLVVVAESSDGAQGLAAVRREQSTGAGVDVVLMDVQMPTMDGIEATRQLTALGERPRVIVLTTFDNDEYVLAAIAAGASGFLLKDADPEELLAAVRTVHNGDAVIAPRSTRRLLEHVGPLLGHEPVPLPADLTARELEVLAEMAHGRTNAEIADALFVSEATVKTHIGKVLAKTGSRDRVHAVLVAFRAGLVRPDEVLRQG
ncbi:response regulator transcription factor [Tomitella biformata]|uniref:response regulator transcription factor n=1 Tax=Tomitella biformata TaxID=630403 RepID=UPI0004646850|nr:response regulator transcription factor [Tomitella biformata]